SISPKTGYTACGWSMSKDYCPGTAAGNTITLDSNGDTYYGNSNDVTKPSTPSFVSRPYDINVSYGSWYIHFSVVVKASDTSGSQITYSINGTNASSGWANKCANNTNCTIRVTTSSSWQNKATTLTTYNVTAKDAFQNSASSTWGMPPLEADSSPLSNWSPQRFYIYQLYGGIRADYGTAYNVSNDEISGKLSQMTGSTPAATIIANMFGSSEASGHLSGKTSRQKCDEMYTAILGRAYNPATGYDGTDCQTQFNQGKTLRQMALFFTNSTEGQGLISRLGLTTGNGT
ncbi:hypothetical protein IKW73_03575, partial [Candidatus Saccharibacteria bacterium]|nr:hypothetical protein [Candidatus Saccharibacteria bacterium]